MNLTKTCPVCKTTFTGRKDKKFCSVKCKNEQNNQKLADRYLNVAVARTEIAKLTAENLELKKQIALRNETIASLQTDLKRTGVLGQIKLGGAVVNGLINSFGK